MPKPNIRSGQVLCFRKPRDRDDGFVQNAIEYIQQKGDGDTLHVALIEDVLDDNAFVVQTDSRGTQLNYKVNVNDPDIAVMSIDEISFDRVMLSYTIKKWYDNLPKDFLTKIPKYDFFGAMRAYIWGVLSNLSGGRLWRRPIIKDSEVPFCSEGVCEILFMYAGWKCIDKTNGMQMDNSMVMPDRDIYRNRKQFRVVSDYGQTW